MSIKQKLSFLCRIGLHSDIRKPLYSLHMFKDYNKNVEIGYTKTCENCKRRIKVVNK